MVESLTARPDKHYAIPANPDLSSPVGCLFSQADGFLKVKS